jgi:hypothetical protein
LVGAALWIGLTVVTWLVRGRQSQDPHFPEVPIDTTSMALTKPVILFSVIQAVAISISVAIAFGLHLPNADWMPIATLVAMKTSLNQATLAAAQRIAGAVMGALIAMFFLLAIDNKHVLQVVVVALGAFAASVRAATYAFCCAAMAALVLIAEDVIHPTNLSAEGRRVLFTFAGLGIGIAVLILAGVIQKRPESVAVSDLPAAVLSAGASIVGDVVEASIAIPLPVLGVLAAWAAERGLDLPDLQVSRPTLEEVYLALTEEAR